MRTTAGPLLCIAALLAFAPPAGAQRCDETGNSGVDQYCESVPGPGGDKGPSEDPGGSTGGGSAGGGASGDAAGSSPAGGAGVSSETARALEGQGSDGASVLRLAGGEGSGDVAQGSGEPGANGQGPASDRPEGSPTVGGESGEAPSDNPLSAITSAVEDGASSGPVFAWILLGLGLVLAGIAWLRYRSNSASDRLISRGSD